MENNLIGYDPRVSINGDEPFSVTNLEVSSVAGTGAVRSNDCASERWDLIAWPTIDDLARGLYEVKKIDLTICDHPVWFIVNCSILDLGRYWSSPEKLEILHRSWAYLAIALQKQDASEKEFDLWVERIKVAFSEGRDYVPGVMPFYALRRMAQTYREGRDKYGAYNWLNGMQCFDVMNHLIKHLFRWCNAIPNKEDDLGHSMWGFSTLNYFLRNRGDMQLEMVGPGYTLTDALREDHKRRAFDREEKKRQGAELEQYNLKQQIVKAGSEILDKQKRKVRNFTKDKDNICRPRRGELYERKGID